MTWLFLQAVVSGLLLGGVYGLVASGLSLIFGVLRIINFAHGAVMMLGMYTSYWLFVLVGLDPYLSILVTGPLFFALGMLIQRIVIEPNRAAAEHNQLLLTLGLALFFENLALVLWQGDFRTVRVWYSGASFLVADVLVEVPRLIAAGGAVLIALALWGFLRMTDAGKAIRALSEEPEGARLWSASTWRGSAASRSASARPAWRWRGRSSPRSSTWPPTWARASTSWPSWWWCWAAWATSWARSLGGFIVGLAESLGAAFLPGSLKQLVVFGLFVVVLLLRPEGLFGARRGR